MTKKAGKFLQALRDIVREHDTDLDPSEIFAVGSVLLLLLGFVLYAIYQFIAA